MKNCHNFFKNPNHDADKKLELIKYQLYLPTCKTQLKINLEFEL